MNKIKDPGTEIIQIPLEGELAEKYAEISGLTWYKDQLIILPQYPDRFSTDTFRASIFRISKEKILTYLDNDDPSIQLSPERIEFIEREIPDRLIGFQGYESILFVENKVYLTIEINFKGNMGAFLIEGTINESVDKIVLDESTLDSLLMPVQVNNFAYESMTHQDEKLYIFYEANGQNLAQKSQVLKVNLDNGKKIFIGFPNIEYRITDATSIDREGIFWVINYFWPGDYKKLNPAEDNLATKSNPPIIFSNDKGIERLVEMRLTDNGFEISQTRPIVIASSSGDDPRNWEGIVRLGNRGFILATDEHPETILAFLPYKLKN